MLIGTFAAGVGVGLGVGSSSELPPEHAVNASSMLPTIARCFFCFMISLFNMITFPRCIWNCQFHLLCKGMKKCGIMQVHNGPYMEEVAKQHIFRG